MIYWNNVEEANARIQELEAEVNQLRGALMYLENDKVPYLERERERSQQRAKSSSEHS